MTTAFAGPGFLLSIGDGGSPEAFTTVLNCKDFKGGGTKTDTVDITNQSSPNGYEEILPTIHRTTDLTFDINWDDEDATHNDTTGLQYLQNAKLLRNMKMTRPDGTHGVSFKGYVIQFDPNRPVSGVQAAAITIKPVGPRASF